VVVVGLREATLEENRGKQIVVIVPSYAERYLARVGRQQGGGGPR